MKTNNIMIILLLIIAIGCQQVVPNNLVGTYVSNNNVNIDSLKIKKSGTYYQSIYRRKDSSLVFRHQNKWSISDDNHLILTEFLLDTGTIFPEKLNRNIIGNTLITSYLPIKKSVLDSKLIIDSEKNLYYEKVAATDNTDL
ncbi:hypothetical protein I5168_08025 [Nonlabens sp. SCSIO 43208]|uniref:hypothetical protein n=1 Tax=Nonlabens sp. SCSIO 43208 TaxID=2793009 RepID=UPI003D6A6716